MARKKTHYCTRGIRPWDYCEICHAQIDAERERLREELRPRPTKEPTHIKCEKCLAHYPKEYAHTCPPFLAAIVRMNKERHA